MNKDLLKPVSLPTTTADTAYNTVGWTCPSNIAIVKYWGKKPVQIPANPSISITLDNAHTSTSIKFYPKKESEPLVSFFLDRTEKPDFLPKINKFINRIADVYPFLQDLDLEIHSTNSFPHSAGIASSASGMSALAMCFVSIEEQITERPMMREDFLQKASYLSRLGSGSACRSVYPYCAVWGQHSEYPNSNNEYAIPYEEQLHPDFKTLHDDILIISSKEKAVSSTLGHQLMDSNIFAATRFEQANKNMSRLIPALKQGDLQAFGEIAEAEALTLHALMMTSRPSFILMQPNTLVAIERIRQFRNQTKLPLYFTLDAGPNIHLLYPDSTKDKVKTFIAEQLAVLCNNKTIIEDKAGPGPQKLKTS